MRPNIEIRQRRTLFAAHFSISQKIFARKNGIRGFGHLTSPGTPRFDVKNQTTGKDQK